MWLKTAAALGVLGAGVLAAPAAADVEPLRAQGGVYDVTLPTGDTVHVEGRGATVTPGPGRDAAFSIRQSGGDLYVVPDDRLAEDPERYNVTALHEGRRPAPEPKASGDLVTVRLKSIARDGRPGLGTVDFLNVEDAALGNARRPLPGSPDGPCTDERWEDAGCVKVRPGTYSVLGVIKTLPSWASSTGSGKPLNFSLVGYPEIEITRDTEIVLDARKAEEVTVRTPEHVTRPNVGSISHMMWTRGTKRGQVVNAGIYMNSVAKLEERVFMQPTAKVRSGTFEAYTRWRLEAPAITMRVRGRSLNPMYYPASYFSDTSDQFPRLDGKAGMRVADGDRPGADLRGRLALVQRRDGVPVAELSNRAAEAGARMVAVYNDKPGVNDDPGGYGTQVKVPTVRLSHEEGRALLNGTNTVVTAEGVVASPYQYDLVFPETGRVSKNLNYVARTRDLARLDNTYYGGGSMTTARYSLRPWEDLSLTFAQPLAGAPRTRVEYVSADPRTTWSTMAATPEEPYNHEFPMPKIPHVLLSGGAATSYKPGHRGEQTWFKAPLAGGTNPQAPIARTGDGIRLNVGLSDAAGNFAGAYTSSFPDGFVSDFRFYRDGTLIAQTPYEATGTVETTPDDAEYRIEWNFSNTALWARHSTRTNTSWTFRSARTTETTLLPVLQVAYRADLDVRNRTRSRTLELKVHRQDGSPARLKRLTLQASFDDGATWTSVPLRNGIARLHGKGAVSLRVNAEDTAGGTVTQEIIRAYELR